MEKMKKKLSIKHGLILLAAFGLVGCSQNQSSTPSTPSINNDIKRAGTQYLKTEYDNAGGNVNTDSGSKLLERDAQSFSDAVQVQHDFNALNKVEQSFVDDVFKSKPLYDDVMNLQNMHGTDKKTVSYKKKTIKKFQDYIKKMDVKYGIRI